MFRINLPEIWKVHYDGEYIIVSNRANNIVHQMEPVPAVVDYIRADYVKTYVDTTYVNGFIEDNLLVILNRAFGDW